MKKVLLMITRTTRRVSHALHIPPFCRPKHDGFENTPKKEHIRCSRRKSKSRICVIIE